MVKKKQSHDTLVRCYDCKYAYLMQTKGNPIIALCKPTMNGRNKAGRREVAMSQRTCNDFVKGYPSPVINPMIPAR